MVALQLERVYKSFGGLLALSGVSLTVERGERRSLIGPNGAGKSTLFRIIGGELRPDKGEVYFFDRRVTGYPPYRLALLGLRRTFQISSLFPEKTALEHVVLAQLSSHPARNRFWPSQIPDLEAKAKALLEQVGLRGRETVEVWALSHGEQRQVEIAMALAQSPALLLMDEPLAGLSDVERTRVKRILSQLSRDITVILIEHDLDFAYSFADKVTVLHQGEVLKEGIPEVVRRDSRVIEVYVGDSSGREFSPASRPRGSGTALEVKELRAGYGQGEVLRGVNLSVKEGEVLALLGRNGMGKTTLLHALMGILFASGQVLLHGCPLPPGALARARMGLSLVPQGRQMIPGLKVEEELLLSQQPGRWTLEKIYSLFPRLKERRSAFSTSLSGGEQQMLAIARALLRNPKVLLMDEPTEGLSPLFVKHLREILKELVYQGETILLAEQNASFALSLANRVCFLEQGRITECVDARELRADVELLQKRLG